MAKEGQHKDSNSFAPKIAKRLTFRAIDARLVSLSLRFVHQIADISVVGEVHSQFYSLQVMLPYGLIN